VTRFNCDTLLDPFLVGPFFIVHLELYMNQLTALKLMTKPPSP
jgi:hypothetical protein